MNSKRNDCFNLDGTINATWKEVSNHVTSKLTNTYKQIDKLIAYAKKNKIPMRDIQKIIESDITSHIVFAILKAT